MGNSKKSEQVAVSALINYFAESKHIDCDIPMNDKSILWDNHLYFHSDEPFSAENLIARLPVQVKGRSLRWKKDINEYPVKRNALENYAKEGGIAYFVVDVFNRNKPVIYYNLLTLVDIRQLIIRHDGEKEIRVPMEKLCMVHDEFENMLLEFINDKQKQSSFVNQPMVTQDLLLLQDSPTLEFTVPASKGVNPILALALGGFHHLYLKTREGVSIPLQDGPFQLQMGNTIHEPVIVDGKTYFDSYEASLGKGQSEIAVGKCLFMTATITKECISFHSARYTMRNTTLSEKINELSFIKDLMKKRDLLVGEHHWTNIKFDDEEGLLDMINASLPFWERIKATLDSLGVKKELSIDNISDDDFEWIKWLDKVFNKNHLVISKTPLPLFQRAKIVNISLLLSFEKVREGEYKVGNAFSDKDSFRLPLKAKSSITMPLYSCLPADAFNGFDNIPYEDIIKSYQRIQEPLDDVLTTANMNLLQMLLAYDESQNVRLWGAIKLLAEWLYAHENFPKEIAFLNKMQITKRERNLDESEIDSLLDFADNTTDKQLKLGALILADDMRQAKRIFKRLNSNEQKYFMSFPIAKFYKPN